MQLLVTRSAEADLGRAPDWYRDQRIGLDEEFMAEVERVFTCLPCRPSKIRRALTHRFPYKIFYVERLDLIAVLAVRHQRPRPQPWLDGP